MKKRMLAILCALAMIGTSPNLFSGIQVNAAEIQAAGTTYYISSIHGDNSASGTSESQAWETLDKLIGMELKPGDQILLEKGSVFNDAYIHLQDVHGTAEAPIKISSYGTGEKPAIHANGQGVWYQDYEGQMDNNNHKSKGYISSTILLYDVDFVEVSDLELTNVSDDFEYFKGAVSSVSETSGRMDRTGVSGIAKDGGTSEHIYLDNLYIHDIDGNIEDKHVNNGGIQMNVIPPENEAETGVARYDDVKITNCYVRNVSRAGICVGYTYQNGKFNGAAISDETAQTYGQTRLVIENNYVKDIGNDAIVAMYAFRPLVQNNISDRSGADMDMSDGGYDSHWQHLCAAVWPWKCKDGIFQYNEVFDTVGDNNQDAQAWDIDYSDGTIYQYNYSHNNGGGAIMFCGGEAYNGVFRYNISQNDLRQLIHLAGNPNGQVYNNVFYLDGSLSTVIFGSEGTAEISNNIFYNISSGKPKSETIVKGSRTFANNIFYGYDGAELPAGSITEDPKFVDPGHAPTEVSEDGTLYNRSVYDGYKLQADSPAINAGVIVDGSPKYDFFGNSIGVQPDIGAFESDTAEDILGVRAAEGASFTVEEESITEVPRGTTVKELKEQLYYAQDITLRILKDSREMQDEDIVTGSSIVEISRGSTTKQYTILIAKEYIEYDPASMTATVGSYQPNNTTEGGADLVLDGNIDTIWHTAYAGCKQDDVWVELDLGSVKPVAMVKYVTRTGGGINGIFTKYKVEVRTSEDDDWVEVDEGSWSGKAIEYSKFDSMNARYVRLSGLETMSKTTNDDGEYLIFGSAAEIRVGYEKPEE